MPPADSGPFTHLHEAVIDKAARAVREASALVIATGAGMGVDSGLPDFRGNDGLWSARDGKTDFGAQMVRLMSPHGLTADSARAWGFYTELMNLCERARPHAGFMALRGLCRRMSEGHFVLTSNLDRHFQGACFDPERIVECHGTMHLLQCTAACGVGLFRPRVRVEVDPATHCAKRPLPACPSCGALARPNVLMFADARWDRSVTDAQYRRLYAWLDTIAQRKARLVVIECGAGTSIATVRTFSERIVADGKGLLIRINVAEARVPQGHIGIPGRALPVLRALAARVSSLSQ
ncbi:NAD-dependent protein deacetylase of SIR2 family protein [Minicystis rosea]|nr:NAD-dependent protein deacetylase of SIR2 family protein [Minicystis rosea]